MTVINWKSAVLIGAILMSPITAVGADDFQVREADTVVHDFALQGGQHLPVLKLHYTTLGMPKRDGSGKITNAVVLLHGTAGVGKSFLTPTLANNLFKPGQPLDIQHYYIVLPDGIGAGGSTKPSDGMRGSFPHYGYIDQVEAQYAMLKSMGIDHVKLVSGLSQGGMQVWIWGERYPEFMDALIPVGTMPMQISGRNLMWRQIIIRSIRNDPDWHDGNYNPTHRPTAWMSIAAPLLTMMVLNPERLQASGPDRAKTLAFYDQLVAQYKDRDASDFLYDFESSSDFDPAPDVGKIKAPLLAINFEDDEVNPVQFTVTQQTVARIPSSRLVVLPGGDGSYGHAGIFHAEIWAKEVGNFLDQTPGWK